MIKIIELNFIFEKKILEDTNIIENIEKFNYFIVALIKSIDKEEFEYNINRLKEYSQKEYELIINHQYNKIFKKYDSKEKFISINNIFFMKVIYLIYVIKILFKKKLPKHIIISIILKKIIFMKKIKKVLKIFY